MYKKWWFNLTGLQFMCAGGMIADSAHKDGDPVEFFAGIIVAILLMRLICSKINELNNKK